MAPVPSHDEVEHVMFLFKYWEYFVAGLGTTGYGAYMMRKGKVVVDKVIPISEKHIDNKLTICAAELKSEVTSDFKEEIQLLKTDLLREIALMIKASK